jgi:hypothetical protein
LASISSRVSGARHVLAGGIADQPGKIADEEHDVRPQFLELAHLVDEYGMSQVQIRRGRIKSGLDAQRPAGRDLCGQLFLQQQLAAAAFDDPHGGFNCIAIHCAPKS